MDKFLNLFFFALAFINIIYPILRIKTVIKRKKLRKELVLIRTKNDSKNN